MPGEPILYFKNIQIALLSENTRVIAAKGGYLNRARVIWEDREDVTFQFSNGTLNQFSLNMLLESKMLTSYEVKIPYSEEIQIQDDNTAYLTHTPIEGCKCFYKLYSLDNIQPEEQDEQGETKYLNPIREGNKLTFPEDYKGQTVMADYYFLPKNGAQIYTMARERRSNLYTLEATFYLKDENDGLLHTGILEMPKVYIMSNINLRMGERADPTVGTFRIVAMPDMLDGAADTVCRVTYLDEDIYGI